MRVLDLFHTLCAEKLPLDILPHMSYIKDTVMGNKAHIKRARRLK